MEQREKTVYHNYLHELGNARANFGWFLSLGILLVILGGLIIGSSYYATVFSVMLFGILLFAGGIVQIVQAFLARKWSGFLLSVLVGILYIFTGFLCMTRPVEAAVSLTLLIAAFCFVTGVFKMVTSLVIRFDQWGWVFFNGLVTFILGVLIYSDWPVSGLWVIGLFIGIDMILAGWSWIILSLAARRLLK